MRINIGNLVTFANDVDNTVSLLESRISKTTPISNPEGDKYLINYGYLLILDWNQRLQQESHFETHIIIKMICQKL